jgi:acetylornithine deacetylase/succinyl-diaminopimelate desuccinylase-like protein
MLPEPVRGYLNDHRERFLQRLFELLRFPSIANVHGPGDPCLACASWLVDYLRGLGLEAQLVPTGAKPTGPGQTRKPCVLAEAHVSDQAPTLLIYGHYDVQPVEPLDLWNSAPFEPVIRDGCIYARGADDDKGQLFTHLMAIEAWRQAGGGLPVNLKLLFEGEEEIGSPDLEPFIAASARRLSADACLISDSEFFADGLPSITYALRGLAYMEVTVTGPSADCHSGVNGGAVANPINGLARIIAAMHDADGRITIPGFYDDVLPLTDAERNEWRKLPMDEAEYAASLGLTELGGGEKGLPVLERRWSRPTLDCNGIVGGYTGAGSKTIIPAQASAKLSARLVANQDPQKVVEGFRRFVAEHTPPGLKATMQVHAEARPVMLAKDAPAMRAGQEALAEAFDRAPAMIRCGASVPITELFQRLLGLDGVLMGFGLPDDNLHAPNEHFRLDHLWRGAVASAAFMRNLRASWEAGRSR